MALKSAILSILGRDDLEWIVRLREAAIPMDIVPDVFLHRRVHTSNISSNQNALALARVRILKEHMDRKRGRVAKPLSGLSGESPPFQSILHHIGRPDASLCTEDGGFYA